MTGPRFVAKQDARGLWGVYDRTVASWPHARPLTGWVAQDHAARAAAEQEAARLNDLYAPASSEDHTLGDAGHK